jgi:hypothetical protein
MVTIRIVMIRLVTIHIVTTRIVRLVRFRIRIVTIRIVTIRIRVCLQAYRPRRIRIAPSGAAKPEWRFSQWLRI